MIIPETKKDIVAESRKKIAEVEAQFNKGIITDGERYNKVIDIWTSATDRIAKEVFAKLEANEGKNEVNPGLHHDGLRRPRQQAAGPPAVRRPRPHGQALRRNHRAPDPLLVPRGPDGARVLHLDPRRPQGPGRHRPQDRRRRLSHAQALRRGDGRHHRRGRLRRPRRRLEEGDHRGRRRDRRPARAHRRPLLERRRLQPAQPRPS